MSGRTGDSSASNLVTISRLRMSLTAESLSSVSLCEDLVLNVVCIILPEVLPVFTEVCAFILLPVLGDVNVTHVSQKRNLNFKHTLQV